MNNVIKTLTITLLLAGCATQPDGTVFGDAYAGENLNRPVDIYLNDGTPCWLTNPVSAYATFEIICDYEAEKHAANPSQAQTQP